MALLALAACNRSEPARVDPADTDHGAFRSGLASEPAPPQTVTTLPSGAQVRGTATAAELQTYLDSQEPAGRGFGLPSISFVKGMDLREDPNGAVATLAAILTSHPQARIHIEVAEANPGVNSASPSAANRAEMVADLFRRNGVPADRISSAGVKDGPSDAPRARLVVTAK